MYIYIFKNNYSIIGVVCSTSFTGRTIGSKSLGTTVESNSYQRVRRQVEACLRLITED